MTTSLELVTLPDPGALERILVSPLKRVGYKFESDKMPEEMIAEVREHPGALALLSFAASKLWDLRDRQFRPSGQTGGRELEERPHGTGQDHQA